MTIPELALDIRAGVGSLSKNGTETPVKFSKRLGSSDYAVTVTEWRNEPRNELKTLHNLYIMKRTHDGFIIGHDRFTGSGDAPSFGWIAANPR